MFVKYMAVGFLMATWKWFYYAPNTYKELKIAEMRRRGDKITEEMGPREAFTLKYFLDPPSARTMHKWFSFREFFGKARPRASDDKPHPTPARAHSVSTCPFPSRPRPLSFPRCPCILHDSNVSVRRCRSWART